MIKQLFSLAIISAMISSCGNSGKKEVSSNAKTLEKGVKVEFTSLIANPDSYVGKNIIIEGKVVHVCMETGKKMFIVGENPDIRLYIAAGENISKFPMELLGSEVIVEGLITKPDGLAMAANKEPGEGMTKTMASDSCETEKAQSGQPSLANIIMEYKTHTVK